MNNPEYILVDEIGAVVSATSAYLNAAGVLAGPINYQYGYVTELKETLQQYSKVTAFANLKFPLVWLVQPYTIQKGVPGYFGKTSLRVFIIQETEATLKATERMNQTFKPVIYPIYREFIKKLEATTNIFTGDEYTGFSHNVTDRYYWGKEQKDILFDVFDCMEINNLKIRISDNQNCSIN